MTTRPKKLTPTAGLLIHVPLDLLDEIEAWRAQQAEQISRTKAIVRFIREGMAATASVERLDKGDQK